MSDFRSYRQPLPAKLKTNSENTEKQRRLKIMSNARNIVHPTHTYSASRCGVSGCGWPDNDRSTVKIIDSTKKYTTRVGVGESPMGLSLSRKSSHARVG